MNEERPNHQNRKPHVGEPVGSFSFSYGTCANSDAQQVFLEDDFLHECPLCKQEEAWCLSSTVDERGLTHNFLCGACEERSHVTVSTGSNW